MPIPTRPNPNPYYYHVYDIPCSCGQVAPNGHVAATCGPHVPRQTFSNANIQSWLPAALSVAATDHTARADAGTRTAELPAGAPNITIHRDLANDATGNDRLSILEDLSGLYFYAHQALNVDVGSIGKTYFDRQIPYIMFGGNNDPAAPQVLLTGGVHAREWIAVEVPYLIAEYLIKNYDPPGPTRNARNARHKAISELIDACRMCVIPMLNPDGHCWSVATVKRLWRKNRRRWTKSQLITANSNRYETARFSRKLKYKNSQDKWVTLARESDDFQDNIGGNRVYFGVDCNRNCWQGGHNPQPNPTVETFAGPAAFTEAESQGLQGLNLPNLAASIDYHSSMGRILFHGDVPIQAPGGPLTDKEKEDRAVRKVAACMYDHITAYETRNGAHGYNYKYGDEATTIEEESAGNDSTRGSIMDLCYRKMIAVNRIPLAYTLELDPVREVARQNYLPGPDWPQRNNRYFHIPPASIQTVFEKNLTAVLCLMNHAITNPREADVVQRGDRGNAIADQPCPFGVNDHEWVGKVSGRGNQAPNP